MTCLSDSSTTSALAERSGNNLGSTSSSFSRTGISFTKLARHPGAIAITPGWRANFVKEIPVRLKLDEVDPRLLPDLSASADVVLESERQVIVAPRQAIFHDGGTGRAFVLLKDASAWRRRYVDLGVTNHVAAAVRSGVHQGDVLAAQLVSSQVYQ